MHALVVFIFKTARQSGEGSATTKAIGAVQLESNQSGVLEVSRDAWNAPTETPADYQVNWARADQSYPTGAENNT